MWTQYNLECKRTNETDKRYCRKFKAETKSHFSREQATTKQRKIHSFSLNNTTIYPAATCIKHWYTFDCLHSLLLFGVPFLLSPSLLSFLRRWSGVRVHVCVRHACNRCRWIPSFAIIVFYFRFICCFCCCFSFLFFFVFSSTFHFILFFRFSFFSVPFLN